MPCIKSCSEIRINSFTFSTLSPPTIPTLSNFEPVPIPICEICESLDSPERCDVINLISFSFATLANSNASYRLPA